MQPCKQPTLGTHSYQTIAICVTNRMVGKEVQCVCECVCVCVCVCVGGGGGGGGGGGDIPTMDYNPPQKYPLDLDEPYTLDTPLR